MKQNERLLVYAVTGFLAIILVIAVVFGREPNNGAAFAGQKGGTNTPSLAEVLNGKGGGPINPAASPEGSPGGHASGSESGANGGVAGLPSPAAVSTEQPLVAVNKAVLAADFVAQKLGASDRDRTVRLVRARSGDSLEILVRRWCGARDPFLDEARSLNETLNVLQAGQQVAVPWVEDEVLKAAIEVSEASAVKPRTSYAPNLQNAPSSPSADLGGEGPRTLLPVTLLPRAARQTPGNPTGGNPTGVGEQPTFAQPGAQSGAQPTTKPGTQPKAAAAGSTYTVVSGDSLWTIAARTYGKKNANRMIGEIRAANPGLDESLQVGQKIVMPAAK